MKVSQPSGGDRPGTVRSRARRSARSKGLAGDRRRRFRAALLRWYGPRARPLRIRTTRDPWAILVSEVMAQQTQIARVDEAWAGFMQRYPTPRALAAATTAEVLRAWSGLGYNRRAVQLQRAAAAIEAGHAGAVPADVAALESLPGVGPYTARAVAAIAFGRPVAPVDTNVRRLVTRLLGERLTARALQAEADALVARRDPVTWTHATMELGATVCIARRPRCAVCPVRRWCASAGRVEAPDGGAVVEVPFELTSRWLRGRIVEQLRQLDDGAWARLPESIGRHGPDRVERAVSGLERDGLLERSRDGRVRLPSGRHDHDPAIGSASTPIERPSTSIDVNPLQRPATGSGMSPTEDPTTGLPLPVSDASLFADRVDIDALAAHWLAQARLEPMTAEEMRGTDARAQRLGTPGAWLMEQAGTAVAAAARALMVSAERSLSSLMLILCGQGNNGGDGLVAARRLADQGIRSEVVLLAGSGSPGTPDARLNWERLEGVDRVRRVATSRDSDVALYFNGIERAGLVIDALLGTGVKGALREPVRTAVDVVVRARESGVPVLAVDTPTSLDLTTGEPSDPVVRADVTVTFHRPKEGLSSRAGRLLAGRVLVAPIGIPREADRG